MLVDHLRARCWLPPGGHVDDGEDPRRSVDRDAFEELGITTKFHEGIAGDKPFFLTVTQTRDPGSHTDVTLWFVLRGNSDDEIRQCPQEFSAVLWFGLDDDSIWPEDRFDPQMRRFAAELTVALS